MNYEQKYKEALDWMRKLYPSFEDWVKEDAEHYFPELKESEDEKNIKDLIDELKCSLRAANCQNYACEGGHEKRIALLEWGIAWLEKQGDTFTKKDIDDAYLKGISDAKNELEKQGEQTQLDYEHADIPQKDFAPIEPKFKKKVDADEDFKL